MKSNTLVSAIIMLLMSGCAVAPFTHDEFNRNDVVSKSYISLETRISGMSLFYGAAIIVSNGVAITNRHMLQEGSWKKGYMFDGTVITPSDIISSDGMDLSIFNIPCNTGAPIAQGNRVKVDEPVRSFGSNRFSNYIEGLVYDVDFLFLWKKKLSDGFIYQASIVPGFSGGPILNEKNELTGINHGYVAYFTQRHQLIDSKETFAIGLHIEDIIQEINRLAPDRLQRCANKNTEI